MDNFWSFILNGGIWMIQTLILPLFGDSTSQAGAMSMAKYISSSAFMLFELIYDTLGSVVNLNLFAIFITVMLVFFFIRLALAIYLFILKLIPVLGHA